MDPIWITIAFLCGFAARQAKLPPLVGYLAAGFVLKQMGVVSGDVLQILSDLGVTLLLFTIGLKLDLKGLLKPEIWLGTSLHMLATLALFGGLILGLGAAGYSLFAGVDLKFSLLIAFALSFSSTVFAIKILEEKGEMPSFHGRVAVGILIMQDVLAVVFITISSGKMPSPWAIAVLAGLFAIRPLLFKMFDHCGHGELTILFGFFLALVVGAGSFDAVYLKPDLGALVIGMLMGTHPKSKEMAKSLFGFKEIFLVAFFLGIGLSGSPSWEVAGIALLLVALIPFKTALFFLILTRFKLRARSATHAALILSNYSEFGLIVCALAAGNGWISGEWLIAVAIALSISFVAASPLNSASDRIYQKLQPVLSRFEKAVQHPDDRQVNSISATLAVFGMGMLGTSVYDYLRQRYGETVIGLDFNEDTVAGHQAAGRHVYSGDASDPDFWEQARTRARHGKGQHPIAAVILAMPNHRANLYAAMQLRDSGYKGIVAAVAMFEDEVTALKDAGVNAAFNFYAEAGAGFAAHVDAILQNPLTNSNS